MADAETNVSRYDGDPCPHCGKEVRVATASLQVDADPLDWIAPDGPKVLTWLQCPSCGPVTEKLPLPRSEYRRPEPHEDEGVQSRSEPSG